jgi:hypothetical protein
MRNVVGRFNEVIPRHLTNDVLTALGELRPKPRPRHEEERDSKGRFLQDGNGVKRALNNLGVNTKRFSATRAGFGLEQEKFLEAAAECYKECGEPNGIAFRKDVGGNGTDIGLGHQSH